MVDIKKKYKSGDVVKLKVVRQSEIGSFLDAETGSTNDDILLHNIQQTSPVSIGDIVEVYLYLDPKGRLTASMRLPKMKEAQIARVKVINTSKDGAFVDIGAERGIFMPFSEMRGNLKVGDTVWAKLYRDKSGRLATTMKVENEIRDASKKAENVKIGDMVTGSVYNITDNGVYIFTNERYIAFLHYDEMVSKPKVGEEISVRITYIRDDGRINVSQRSLKEDAILDDSNKILNLLKNRGGQIPYSDETASEIIKQKFNISKSAFKRALGNLIKQGLIRQENGWTILIPQEIKNTIVGDEND